MITKVTDLLITKVTDVMITKVTDLLPRLRVSIETVLIDNKHNMFPCSGSLKVRTRSVHPLCQIPTREIQCVQMDEVETLHYYCGRLWTSRD